MKLDALKDLCAHAYLGEGPRAVVNPEFVVATRKMVPKLIAVAEAASLTVYAEKKCSEPLYAYGVEQLRVTLAALESE